MALDPQVKALLDMMAAAGGPPLEEMGVPAAREMYLAMRPPIAGAEVAKVEDRRIPGGTDGVRSGCASTRRAAATVRFRSSRTSMAAAGSSAISTPTITGAARSRAR